MSRLSRVRSAPVLVALFLAAPAASQCLEWSGVFAIPGPSGDVYDQIVWDDGSGPALYIGGAFRSIQGVPMSAVARFDGTTWSGLAGGVDQPGATVVGFAIHDDGTGEALYASGSFNAIGGVAASRIARWDGTSWSPLGPGVTSAGQIAVYDEGNGPQLFSLGGFTQATRIQRWDGTNWTGLGTGLVGGKAETLGTFDDGSGEALYVAGQFSVAGQVSVRNVARWDGIAWSDVGGGLEQEFGASTELSTMLVHDDGSGSALYIGGPIESAGLGPNKIDATGLVRWNGTAWSAPGGGLAPSSSVVSLVVTDLGAGTQLYAGGPKVVQTGNTLASWDGTSWSAVNGLGQGEVHSLCAFDDGAGAGGVDLYVGGTFFHAGGMASQHHARWDGAAWSFVGHPHLGVQDEIDAFAEFDAGSGPRLIAGGMFVKTGPTLANHVAAWDGSAWSTLGAGTSDRVYALAVFDDGGGSALYAGGEFISAGGVAASHIARWDGATWAPVAGGVNARVRAFEVHDDGSGAALYVGGDFTQAGGAPASRVARWNGTAWSALGAGTSGAVLSLESFDLGSGPLLAAGGSFLNAGGAAATRVAQWDGSAWSPMDVGLAGDVHALQIFDDGGGPAVYGGGAFNLIRRWNGATWSAAGTSFPNPTRVRAFLVHDDGSGPKLHVGGLLHNWSQALDHVRFWNGNNWSIAAGGVQGEVGALATYSVDSALYAGGDFSNVNSSFGAKSSLRIGRFGADCTCTPEVYCVAGTSASGCQARIGLIGLASASAPSGFHLTVKGVEGLRDGVFFYGVNGRVANPWGNGTSSVCVQGPVFRGARLRGTGTPGSCEGAFAYDLNARWTQKPNSRPAPGIPIQAQFWYRDGQNTSNQTSSMSDAIEFYACP
jgi:hypothetical protein